MIRAIIVSILTIVALAATLLASEDRTAPPLAAKGAQADLVLIDKSDRKLTLLQEDEIIFETDIALGFDPIGQKRREGDGRTPEGEWCNHNWKDNNERAWLDRGGLVAPDRTNTDTMGANENKWRILIRKRCRFGHKNGPVDYWVRRRRVSACACQFLRCICFEGSHWAHPARPLVIYGNAVLCWPDVCLSRRQRIGI